MNCKSYVRLWASIEQATILVQRETRSCYVRNENGNLFNSQVLNRLNAFPKFRVDLWNTNTRATRHDTYLHSLSSHSRIQCITIALKLVCVFPSFSLSISLYLSLYFCFSLSLSLSIFFSNSSFLFWTNFSYEIPRTGCRTPRKSKSASMQDEWNLEIFQHAVRLDGLAHNHCTFGCVFSPILACVYRYLYAEHRFFAVVFVGTRV